MRRFLGGLLLTLLGTTAGAQQGNINVSVFRESDTRARAEICWQVEPAALHYQHVRPNDSLIAASYETELRIYKDTTLVKTDRWMTRTPPAVARQAAQFRLLDGYSQAVPPGKYRVELQCTEPVSPQTTFILRHEFEVDMARLKFIATPQLLDTFYAASKTEGVFVRKDRTAVPLAIDFLGDEKRFLHFYTEAYERPEMQRAAKPFRIESNLLRGEEAIGRFSRTDTLVFQNGTASLYATLPVAKLPSGNFVLQTRLLDAGGKVWAATRRPFQRSNTEPEADTLVGAAVDSVLRSQPPTEYVDITKTFVQAYKPAQLRAMLRMLQPLATPEEGLSIRVLSQPGADPAYLRSFIYTFFRSREPKDAEGAWKAYADRVRTVNRLFNLGGRMGYETERGRVYLQYGPPTERTTVYTETGSRPYEVWRYDTLPKDEKGGKFLFFQPGGPLEDFMLLHSTAIGELRNRSWRAILYPGGANERARAETLFPER